MANSDSPKRNNASRVTAYTQYQSPSKSWSQPSAEQSAEQLQELYANTWYRLRPYLGMEGVEQNKVAEHLQSLLLCVKPDYLNILASANANVKTILLVATPEVFIKSHFPQAPNIQASLNALLEQANRYVDGLEGKAPAPSYAPTGEDILANVLTPGSGVPQLRR
jgi:hypothetical protein